MDPAWQERYGARVDAYRLPTDEQERRTLARQIATDGYRLLGLVTGAHSVISPTGCQLRTWSSATGTGIWVWRVSVSWPVTCQLMAQVEVAVIW